MNTDKVERYQPRERVKNISYILDLIQVISESKLRKGHTKRSRTCVEIAPTGLTFCFLIYN